MVIRQCARGLDCIGARAASRGGVLGWLGARTGLIACLVLYGSAGPALAQLSSEDIAALRERGQAEGWTFTIGENEATNYPLHELCGAVEPPDWHGEGRVDPSPPTRSLPISFDWRDYNGCTPIRNQAGCGSFWAFSAIGAMESAILIADGTSEDLSEQWLVSCTGAGSCSGGWHTSAFNYLRCNGSLDPCGDGGAVLESDFPYIASNAPCNCPYPHPYYLVSWTSLGSGVASVNQIKQAIFDHGPVSVCVHVNSAFSAYTGGVFNDCENSEPINHAVVLVGWDNTQGTNGVWILRNSWGPGWGDNGYMLIEYGCSRIGYASCYVSYNSEDCNGNSVPDACDIAAGTSEDCQPNSVPDECDLAGGTSYDCTGNTIPDECEADCNENGIRDDCDIAAGTSMDCNANTSPDECDIAVYTSTDCNSNTMPDECDIAAGTSQDCNGNSIADECDFRFCGSPWDGFPENDPPELFQFNQFMSEVDYDGDALFWDNPAGNAIISMFGCETSPPDPFDFSVRVTVPTSGEPEDGYVTSEYFRTVGGELDAGASIYSLSFSPQILGAYGDVEFNHKYDWEFFIYDASTGDTVIQIEFASAASMLVPQNQRGRILVKNPAGYPAYLNTGVGFEFVFDPVSFQTGTQWFDFEVVLDNVQHTVKLYIDGELKAETSRLDPNARRMDYFHLQPVRNFASTSGATSFRLDRFERCLTGGAALPPSVYDCNNNGTLDECDITAGTSEDCNADGVPDECQIFGDFDGDEDIDLIDYVILSGCVTGPDAGPVDFGCELGNFDCDGDIDLADLHEFQAAFSGGS